MPSKGDPVDPLTTADIDRRRSRLLRSVFILLAAFASASVGLSFLAPSLLPPLDLSSVVARLGILLLTAGFVVLAIERDRALSRLAGQKDRERVLAARLKSRLDVLESLLDAGDRLNAPLAVPDVLDVLLNGAIELVGAEGGSVTAFDEGEPDISVARRHAVPVDLSLMDLTELVEFPLVIDGRKIGQLALALPFDRDDPILIDLLARFLEGATRALQRVQALADEQASVAYLSAANVVKARFLETVSHELRTPLTSIIGYSRTLELRWDQLPDETKLEFARAVNEQGGRLKMLVERLLEAARVELEGVTVKRVVHDVRRSVERALSVFDHDLDRLALAVPGIPIEGNVDPFVVEQAVQNLVDNALRYTDGEVRVSLDAYRSSIVIRVSDRGPGLDALQLRHVLEPLCRVDENVHSGTGLGLHIVRTLVQDHGGRLDLSSDETGTRAQVTLPRGASRIRAAAV
jgi:signal transduction histidine kinase